MDMQARTLLQYHVNPEVNQSSSARTFTVLPFTFPADNLRTATLAMLRATAT